MPGLFGLWRFKLAVVSDGFSRFPLAARVFLQEPTAQSILRLFEIDVERFAVPRHLVTDQGSQFIAKEFLDRVKELGALHRFGAIGKTGSIALIERLWRTLKQYLALVAFKPLVLDELEQRLIVVFYIESRRFLIRDSPRPATTYEQKTGGADGVKGA